MIDTIKLILPDFQLPRAADDEKWKYDPRSDLCILDAKKLAPSLAPVRLVFNDSRREMTIEASLPRVLHGHNAVLLDLADINRAVEHLRDSWIGL
jgi:hypothetical protein